ALQKLAEYNVQAEIILDRNRPTTFKTRYMAGKQKLFRVSRLMDTDINVELEDQLIQKIEELAPSLDNIIVSDFVYGVITDRVLAKLMEVTAQHNIQIFGDLQCSSQVGNVLKFKNFDMIFPTEKEARIAINNKDDGLEFVSQTVFERSQCNNLVIKLGANGLIAYSKTEGGFIESEHFPALSINPVDVSGAGDSVLAAISTAITSGMNMLDAAALGCVVASCAVEMIGNCPIDANRATLRMEDITRKSEIKSLN
ncbi:MAG: PfkB family carbohydrate kinase, partial [Candidatus Puniceispirillaceae bacterium]